MSRWLLVAASGSAETCQVRNIAVDHNQTGIVLARMETMNRGKANRKRYLQRGHFRRRSWDAATAIGQPGDHLGATGQAAELAAAQDCIAVLQAELADAQVYVATLEHGLPAGTLRALRRNRQLELFLAARPLRTASRSDWVKIHRAFVNANPGLCYDKTPPAPLGFIPIAWSRSHVVSVDALRESFRRYLRRKQQAVRAACDLVA